MDILKNVSKSNNDLKTFKNRENFTKLLAKEYVICIQKILLNDDCEMARITFNDSSKPQVSLTNIDTKNKLSQEVKFVLCINLALQSLNDLYVEILYNEFIFPKDKQWWKNFYAPSTFYRNKTLAINNFVENYHYE